MKQIVFTLLLSVIFTATKAQNVAITNDGTLPDPKAMLDVKSTTKGFLLPRMSETDRGNITGSVPLGLIVFQTDADRGFYYNASALPGTPNWKKITTGDEAYWQYASPNYLYWNGVANVGIGTPTPQAKLHVSGSVVEKLRLENTTPLAVDINNEAYFKTGSWFTGSIKTIGTGPSTARMSFFTYAASVTTGLHESMSILDNGSVGIGNINPTKAKFSVTGSIGSVPAMFGDTATGVAIESNFPGIGFNSYYNLGRKSIANGFGSLIGQNPNNGDLYIQSSAATGTAGNAITTTNRLLIDKDGDIGIEGNSAPHAPLSFANTVGSKISLFGSTETTNYGLGIQGALMQLYTNNNAADIAFGYGGSNTMTETMRIKGTGSVGIGVVSPTNKLDVNGRLRLRREAPYGSGVWIDGPAGNQNAFIGMEDDNTLGFYSNFSGWTMHYDVMDGTMRLGTTQKAAGYVLNVGGKAIAEEVRVQLQGNWPDYVFKRNYTLMPLPQLEAYVKQNNHLPNIPAAEKLEKEGTDLGEMQRKMMEKIEELTLYVIEQDKKIKELELKISKKNEQ